MFYVQVYAGMKGPVCLAVVAGQLAATLLSLLADKAPNDSMFLPSTCAQWTPH